MPIFERCEPYVEEMVTQILERSEHHQQLLSAQPQIDLVFAFPNLDDNGIARGYALTKGGLQALAIARKLSLKERVMGRGDCEIAIDGPWWKEASVPERIALLDHELYHFAIVMEDKAIKRDDFDRPVIRMRKHDAEFGWFKIIADIHGKASQECKQAAWLMDHSGQSYWPDLFSDVPGRQPANA